MKRIFIPERQGAAIQYCHLSFIKDIKIRQESRDWLTRGRLKSIENGQKNSKFTGEYDHF